MKKDKDFILMDVREPKEVADGHDISNFMGEFKKAK